MKDTPTSRRPAALPSPLRTFIAVELDDEARRQLKTLQMALQPLVPPSLVRWVAPENVHITLKFLGDTQPDQVAAVTSALDGIGPTLAPFQVTLAAADLRELGKKAKNTVEGAKQVGAAVAEKCVKAGIKTVVFDRGSSMYHGKVKALADGAREGGLVF